MSLSSCESITSAYDVGVEPVLQLDQVFDVLVIFQVNFNGDMCQSIFGAAERDFYWNKWIHYNSNALYFWNCLDYSNRKKVVKYVKKRWM